MSNDVVFYLDKTGFVMNSDQGELERLRDQYHEKKHLFFDEFLSPKLLTMCLDIMPKLDDSILTYQEGCQENRIQSTAGSSLIRKLCFIYSDKKLLKSLEFITGIERLHYVTCRMYYVEPDAFHDWHEDSTIKNRKLVMITNLSENLDGCGHFQIRNKNSSHLLGDRPFTKQGETLCFGVEQGQLEHRVLPSKGIRRANLLASFYGY